MRKLKRGAIVLVTAVIVVLLTPMLVRSNNGDLVNQGAPGNFGAWPVTVIGGLGPAGTLSTNTTWFVDTGSGSDSNTCLASGATACKTIQHAWDLLASTPFINAVATVSVAAGNYTGLYMGPLLFKQGAAPAASGSYAVVKGTMINATPATGTASGTATAAAQNSGVTWSALTDAGQTWTAHNLKGLCLLVSNTPPCWPIDDNTATVITIVGTTSLLNGGTPTYVIQDWGTVINVGVSSVKNFVGSGGASGVMVHNPFEFSMSGFGTVVLSQIRITGLLNGVQLRGGQILLDQVKIDGATSQAGLVINVGSATVRNSTFLASGSAAGILVSTAGPGLPDSIANTYINNSAGNGNCIDLQGQANESLINQVACHSQGSGGFAFMWGEGLDLEIQFTHADGWNECYHSNHGLARGGGVGFVELDDNICTSPTVFFYNLVGASQAVVDLRGSTGSSGANANSIPIYNVDRGARVVFSNALTAYTSAGGTDYKLDNGEGGGTGASNTIVNLQGFSPRCETSSVGSSICAN